MADGQPNPVPNEAKMPPFSSVLKGREVEDPVNLLLHRPLAYAFTALVFPTSITPNQITLLALVVGLSSGVAWFIGTPTAMIVGGILLWTSAILDGADGILARAKKMQSAFGRALDGTADMFVAAGSLAGAFYHICEKAHSFVPLTYGLVATLTTLMHLPLYDYYKESFLRMTRVGVQGGEGEDLPETQARRQKAKEEGMGFVLNTAMEVTLGFVRNQHYLVKWTNKKAERAGKKFVVTEASAAKYRKYNQGPMRLWTAVSLCPHTYLISIFAMFDRLDLYLWVRLIVMNTLFVIAIAWQRWATNRTGLDEIEVR